jgi:hypothetical protein
VCPGLEGEVGLGVEPDSEDDDGEEGGDVAGQLPVLPLARLPGRQRRPVEEVPLGPLLVPWRRPAPGPIAAAAGARCPAQPRPQHPTCRRRDRPHRACFGARGGVVDLGAWCCALWRLESGRGCGADQWGGERPREIVQLQVVRPMADLNWVGLNRHGSKKWAERVGRYFP